MDYTATNNVQLVFNRGDSSVCHSVPIRDDTLCELDPVERFFSDLSFVSGIPVINIFPPSADIIIDDENEPECGKYVYMNHYFGTFLTLFFICEGNISVGYETTLYTIPEEDIMVELCVVIFDPPTGGAPRPFVLSYATADGSASEYIEEYYFVNEFCSLSMDDVCLQYS